MKFNTSTILAVIMASGVQGLRDQTTKKDPTRRHLQSNAGKICTVNHDIAQTTTEKSVPVEAFPGEQKGLFKITLKGEPYARGTNSISTMGWCVDYDRYIDTGTYSMDIFTAFDADIHTDAIDRRDRLPNLTWLINHINVGDIRPTIGTCKGGTLSWQTMQSAIWYLIDTTSGYDSHGDVVNFMYYGGSECQAKLIAQEAITNGANYQPDCYDDNEQIPLVLVADNGSTITNQVIISETNVHTVTGLCKCVDPTPPPTKAPTAPPTRPPTSPPTRPPTSPPTRPPTSPPTLPPALAPTPATVCTPDALTRLDFDSHPLGTFADAVAWQDGITIASESSKRPMLYDSRVTTGGDTDLDNYPDEKMILIISEDNDPTDPDDNAGGGTLVISFPIPMCITYMGLMDLEESGGTLTLLDGAGGQLYSQLLPVQGDGVRGVMTVGQCGVRKMKIKLIGSGAITYVEYKCPPAPTAAPTAPPTNPPTKSPTSPPTSPPTMPPTSPPTSPPTKAPTSPPTNPPSPGPTMPPTNPPTSPPTKAPTSPPTSPPTKAPTSPPTNPPTSSPTTMRVFTDPPRETPPPTRPPTATPTPVGSSSGDPHFKTWMGDKYDYHGECDLVLLDHPTFNGGQGLKVHIRTTRVKYFSFIEKVAVQIGEEVLEFDNDVENFLINGEPVEANQLHKKTLLAGFVVRRDSKALSIRIHDEGAVSRHTNTVAKIDLHTRKNGFPAVIVDGGHTDVFKGSQGLLGDWETGNKVGRDGQTVFEVDPENAEDFALEWQVRDDEPLLFKDARFPQFPQTCVPPQKMLKTRLGYEKAKAEAEEACGHWKEDMEDCIFDVMATRDILVAEEGHIVHVEW